MAATKAGAGRGQSGGITATVPHRLHCEAGDPPPSIPDRAFDFEFRSARFWLAHGDDVAQTELADRAAVGLEMDNFIPEFVKDCQGRKDDAPA